MEQIEKKTLILPISMSFLKDTYILQLSNFILLIFIDNFNVKFDFSQYSSFLSTFLLCLLIVCCLLTLPQLKQWECQNRLFIVCSRTLYPFLIEQKTLKFFSKANLAVLVGHQLNKLKFSHALHIGINAHLSVHKNLMVKR